MAHDSGRPPGPHPSAPRTGRTGRRRLAAAACLGLALPAGHAALAAAPALAQQAAQQGTVQSPAAARYDIDGGPLGAVLSRFAAAAGVTLSFDAALTQGKTSPGLHDRVTVAEGFARLLDGSGLTWRFVDPGTVRLEGPPAGGALTLGTLTVEGAAGAETARGPVDGYVARRSATGTKTDTPLLETPQAINVVTRDQMDDQGVQSVAESLRYTPGVVAQYGDNDVRHDWLTVRGFTPGRYLDGLRLPFGARGYAQPRVETYGLERVEVLKGPSSILYGQGTPGGTVNMVRKRPTDAAVREVAVQTGTPERWQGAVDLGGRIDDEGRLLGRIVGLGRVGDTHFDHVEEEKIYVAPSLTWRPGDATEVTLLGEYQRIESDGGGGAPALPANGTLFTDAYAALPRDTFVGEPGFDRFTNEQWFVGYEASHDINDTWSLRQNLRHGEVDVDTQRVQAVCLSASACDPAALLRYAWAFPETARLTTVDTQAVARFTTGAVAHTALAGVDYSYETSRFEESALQVLTTPFNAYNPAYGVAAPTRPAAAMIIEQDRSQVGAYVQDQLEIAGFTLTLGARHDWTDTDTETTMAASGTTTRVEQQDRAFTGRAGLVYAFDNGIAPYASWATSFQPAGGSDRSGTPFEPTEGEQIELGVKYQPPGSHSMVTLAAYRLVQRNVLTPDPVDTRFNEQTGEVRMQGVELEGKARLTDSLSLVASYAYTDSEITEANANASGVSLEGNRYAFVPRHQASAWADYTVREGALAGLGVGAGVRWMGQTYGDNANTFDIEGYALVDAAIRYDLGAAAPQLAGLGVAVNAQNLFDKEYVATCLGTTGCYYGTGRTVYATLTYRW